MHRVRSSPAVGNLSTLLDSADGSLDAKYEYGAFGETLRVSGTTIAADNPFRFSTKFLDKDGARKRVDGDAEGVARRAEEAGAPWALMRQSGLLYYGYRYYSPSLGRFLNRDPMGEEGGTNLYAFVENDPVNGWDYLGLNDELVCDPADYSAGLCDDDGPRKRGFFKRLGKFLGGIGKAIGGAGRALGNVARGVGRAAGNIGGTVVGAVGDIGTQIVGTARGVGASIFGSRGDQSIYEENDGEGIKELPDEVLRYDRDVDSQQDRKKEHQQEETDQREDEVPADEGIGTIAVLSDAVAGSGVPTIRKPRFAGAGGSGTRTSPASVSARATPLNKVRLSNRVWAPTYSNLGARTANVAAVTGRWMPLIGTTVAAVDTATSTNRWRTGVGHVFGIVGGTFGAALGVAGSTPTGWTTAPIMGTAGAIGGAAIGQGLGHGIYDFFSNSKD